MECLQAPGDIMFVPAGWSHQTINIGEAIGVGAQRTFGGQSKLDAANEALRKSPYNIEALKMRAVALSHAAIEEERRVKRSITAASRTGMVRVRGDEKQNVEFRNLILEGEDTWLLLFMPPSSDPKDEASHIVLKEVAKMWSEVAGAVKGVISVGLVEALNLPEARSRNLLEPKIVISYGDTRQVDMTVAEAVRASDEYFGHREKDEIVDFALQGMAQRPKARTGSATAIGAKARRIFSEAEDTLRMLLSVQPRHPEALTILVEILGYSGSLDRQQKVAEETAKIFEHMLEKVDYDLPTSSSSSSINSTVAALYHNLASSFLANENPRAALPYLFRSKEISPDYLATMVDIVGAYYMIGDEEKAAMAIQAAREAGVPDSHPEIRRVQRMKLGHSHENKPEPPPMGKSKGEIGLPPRPIRTSKGEEL